MNWSILPAVAEQGETFGQRLARLLEERHFGKAETAIAKQAGVGLQTLKDALADASTPRLGTVEKLAAYCQVSVEYLLTGEGPSDPPPPDVSEVLKELRRMNERLSELTEQVMRLDGDSRS